jgi:hypothetical protein
VAEDLSQSEAWRVAAKAESASDRTAPNGSFGNNLEEFSEDDRTCGSVRLTCEPPAMSSFTLQPQLFVRLAGARRRVWTTKASSI